MFRLIFAIGVAAMLLPDHVHLSAPVETQEYATMAPVTTFDTLSAAQSLYTDLSEFCDRNEEACVTGQAIVAKLAVTAKTALNSLQGEVPDMPVEAVTDEVVTGSISKEVH